VLFSAEKKIKGEEEEQEEMGEGRGWGRVTSYNVKYY